MKKTTQSILFKDTLTEKDILLLKRRINSGEQFELKESYNIEPLQFHKGMEYLHNLYMSPTGKVRVSNPFGAREEYVIENARYITFDGFVDSGNRYIKFYTPIYTVHATDDSSFQYTVTGNIKIIG